MMSCMGKKSMDSMDMLRYVLNWIYPEKCVLCRKTLPINNHFGGICADCHKDIPFIKPPRCIICGRHTENSDICVDCTHMSYAFEKGYSVFEYENVKESIHRFKYEGIKDIGKAFSHLMVRFVEYSNMDINNIDVIMPVPLYKEKLRKRGFNQSELLALGIGEAFGIEVDKTSLLRIHETRPQSLLDVSERKKNVKGAFKVMDEKAVFNKTVLLVDDIFTSGATLNECSEVLLRGGVSSVQVFALSLAGR